MCRYKFFEAVELINLSKRGWTGHMFEDFGTQQGAIFGPQKTNGSERIIWSCDHLTGDDHPNYPKKEEIGTLELNPISVKIPIETHAESVEVQECSYMGIHQKV